MNEKIKVPFGTMSITDSAKKLVSDIMDSGRLSSGKYVRQLEEEFAALIGTREAVALSFIATGNSVLHAGFVPVFVRGYIWGSSGLDLAAYAIFC